jgi:hypothetical protein
MTDQDPYRLIANNPENEITDAQIRANAYDDLSRSLAAASRRLLGNFEVFDGGVLELHDAPQALAARTSEDYIKAGVRPADVAQWVRNAMQEGVGQSPRETGPTISTGLQGEARDSFTDTLLTELRETD